MGVALNVIGGRVTNPGATITALTVNTGDSFTVRSFPFENPAYLEQVWAQNATAGVVRIRSPRLHDQAQAIRLRSIASSPQPLLPYETQQPLFPQDVLTVEQSGGGAETDCLAFLVYYGDLPGVDARLARWEEIAQRIRNIIGLEQNLTTGATAGDWGGSQALNADFDILKRNIDYAVLGYLTDTAIATIGVTGPETGNLRVGGPGATRSDITADWFAENSRRLGLPMIPIFNAANSGAITVDAQATQVSTAINVTLILAELGA